MFISVASAASLLLATPLFFYTDLSDALDALETNKPLGKVSMRIGVDATRRIRSTTEEVELERLIRIARAGRAVRPLGRALVQHVQERGAGMRVAVRALAALPESMRKDLTERPTRLWGFNLKRLLERELTEQTEAAVLTLLVPTASAEVLTDLYRRWNSASPRRTRLLLERLATCAPKHRVAMFEMISRRPPEGEHRAALITCLRGLAPHPKIGASLVQAVERGRLGPHDAYLHTLGDVPTSLWARAAKAALRYVEELSEEADADEQERLAGALLSAARLLQPEVLAQLPALLERGTPVRVRLAAVEALGHVAYRDAPTIKLLIRLIQDPNKDVAKGAYKVLLKKAASRSRIPMRVDAWSSWLRAQKLPDEAPQEPAERLAKQRKVAAMQYQIKHGTFVAPDEKSSGDVKRAEAEE